MALVFPFRGFRFNQGVVGDLNKVVTQPYDKTTPSMQDDYYKRSPYNAVRLTLNLEKREDPDTGYPDAGSIFRQWLDQRVLTQDAAPAIYAYYQEYILEGQTRIQKGFIALLDLRNSESGIIPHERTLAAPKQDRLQLMRSLEGNDDLIFMLYSDDRLAVNCLMDRAISGRLPEIEVTDDYGAIHRLWAITDAETLEKIQSAMTRQKLYIADGHHRFETSVNFLHECERKKWKPMGVESFDKRMVTCFNIAAGVSILPTHRLIRDLPDFDARVFLRAIECHFEVEPVSSAATLAERMSQEQQDHVFGFYSTGLKAFYFLRMRNDALEDPVLANYPEPYRQLDVSILHALLMEHYLGIDEAKLVAQANVDYAREREVCIQMVNEGKYQAVFFVNPTTAQQMQRIAELGERMPQKSTDFYPKLLTGLVFMKMDIAK
jgi:uncharacterized protein (DUF1015 family)